MKHHHKLAVGSIATGLLIIVLSHISFTHDERVRFAQEIGKDVGIAFLLFGGFSVLLELRETKKYFSERLKELLIQQEYLTTLDPLTLEQMWTTVAKAKFKNEQLDEPDSFLHFLYGNVTDYLKLPYHENVGAEVVLTRAEHGGFIVSDTVTYTCRAVGGKIDAKIGWAADESAFREVHCIEARVTYPTGHDLAGHTDLIAEAAPGERTLIVDLKDYNIDGLVVELYSHYVIDGETMQSWTQEQPCRILKFSAHFPEDLDLDFTPFVPTKSKEEYPPPERRGCFHYVYSDWTLPRDGCMWMLRNPGAG